jgi:hypothetical protein
LGLQARSRGTIKNSSKEATGIQDRQILLRVRTLMKLYGLESTVNSSGDVVELLDSKGRLSSYFIWGRGDGRFLQFSSPSGRTQTKMHFSDVINSDFLEANIGIPIFSKKAQEILSKKLGNEVEFHACKIECEGNSVVFYLCNVLKMSSLIDENRTSFRNLPEGDRIITQAIYQDDVKDDFYIARDENFRERLVVSEKFVSLSQAEKLDVSFGRPV